VRDRLLDWVERHRPHWFADVHDSTRTQASGSCSASVAGGDRTAGTH
jgi:hypothetical protein